MLTTSHPMLRALVAHTLATFIGWRPPMNLFSLLGVPHPSLRPIAHAVGRFLEDDDVVARIGKEERKLVGTIARVP